MIVLDYETRSLADLPEVGAYNYAEHPSTDILCLALYDDTTGEYFVFDPAVTDLPQIWRERLKNDDTIMAVNATFDRLIHKHVGVPEYGFPDIPLERWYCASAQFRVNALPANLEDAALAARVANLKNPRGKQLIKELSIPQADGQFKWTPELADEMMVYCLDDVKATVAVVKSCRRLTPQEREDWQLCEQMNDRGIAVDTELAQLATNYAEAEQAEIAGKLAQVTGGAITKPTQHQRIKQYVLDAVANSTDENDSRLLKLMTVHKKGERKISLDKDVRASIITAIDETGLNLYEDIEELIRLLDAASASSVAKFKKMLNLAHPKTRRVRGAFIHAGASQTHRFSSKGLQLHNMRRDSVSAEEAEKMKERMAAGEMIPDVMQTLAKLLRPAVVPRPGYKFVVGDWSGIEARGLPWVTNDPRAEKKLDLFRKDVDIYVEAAKGIFNKPEIGKDDRQVGKISELSLGYGGAVGAFSNMAKAYGVVLPEYKVKRIVSNWRASNPWAVDFWAALENAAKSAIRKGGKQSYSVGHVTYHYVPGMLGGTLICELPDGTCIQYPFARIEYSNKGDNIVALKAGIKPKATDDKYHWGTVRLWGGLLAENITQALCAAILRNSVRSLGPLQMYLAFHVHDEIVLEVPEQKAETLAEQLKIKMELTPSFAKGFPLKAEPVVMDRYGNH